MKKLVVVADDFGLCQSVNEGALEAHTHGIVTELSLMLGSPGTDHALQLIKEHNLQNVGIHMLLKNWRDTGATFRRADYTKLFDETSSDEIAQFIEAELAEFVKLLGRQPSHITSQYGILSRDAAQPTAVTYAASHNIPMRQPRWADDSNERDPNSPRVRYVRERGARTTDRFISHTDDVSTAAEAEQAFLKDFSDLPADASVEIALHPGHIDDELRSLSSLVEGRQRDLDLALSPSFRQAIEDQGIKIVSYREI